MHIAYLILAHNNPELVGRLIGALDNNRAHFFIHIDRKADINEFQRYTAQRRKVHYIENRIKVHWGGFSMVEAIVNLLQEAIKSGVDFNYAILLSGAHYPIKSNDYIFKYLENSNYEYLQFAEASEVGGEYKTKCYCLYDYTPFNPRTTFFQNRYLNRIARIPGFAINFFFRKIIPIFYERKLIENIIPYTGSNWWALTKPCVNYILNYVKSNKAYIDFFRYSIAPDETFFHTIVCNSTFKLVNSNITLQNLIGKYIGPASTLKGLSLTFMKCSSAGDPKTLCETDIDEIKQEFNFFGYPQLFARKFDPKTSYKLLDIIDKDILRHNFPCDDSD